MKIGLLLSSILMAKRFDYQIFAPGEIFLALVNGFSKRGHDVYVYSAPDSVGGVKLISGNNNLAKKDYYSANDLKKDLFVANLLASHRTMYEYDIELVSRAVFHANKEKLDILHNVYGYYAPYFTCFSNMPIVHTLHDHVPPANTLNFLRYKLFADQNYIAISNSIQQIYKKTFQIDCVGRVYNGIDLTYFTYSEKPKDNMLFLGRYLPEKGIVEAIKVAMRLKITLKIASSKDFKTNSYYTNEVKPYLDRPYIQETPFLTPAARNGALRNARLVLFPIQWEEPFGLVVAESMACGTPVVAFARGAVPEIIKDGETGFLVNPSDDDIRGNWVIKKTGVDGLCEAVKKIYSMKKDDYQNMRKRCRQHVENHFTVGKMTDAYEKVYSKLIKN